MKISLNSLKNITLASWRHRLPIGVLLAIIVALLLYRLGPLTHGISSHEIATIKAGRGWNSILDNPLNAPYLMLVRLVAYASLNHISLFRLISVAYGLLSLGTFAYILKRWYGQRAAYFGLILFSTSSFFFHISRLATPEVLLFAALPVLILVHVLLAAEEARGWVLWLWIFAMAVSLYVPGLVWFVLINLIWQRKELWETISDQDSWWQKLLLFFFPIVLLVPLVLGFVKNPALWKPWIGLPDHLAAPLKLLEHLGQNISAIFVWRTPDPEQHLGHLPTLNSFFVILFIVGFVFYMRHWQAPRSRLLALFFILGLLLSALGGPVNTTLVLPIVMLVVVAGIAYLLHQWLTVFPRNPLARSLGISIISVAIILSALLGVRRYFIAWPYNLETRQTFNHQLVLK